MGAARATCPWPSLCSQPLLSPPTQASLMQVGHLDSARKDQNGKRSWTVITVCPCHGPRGVEQAPRHGVQSFTNPSPAIWAEPVAPARLAPWGAGLTCQEHIGEVRGETSAVRRCGWGRDRAASTPGTLPFSKGAESCVAQLWQLAHILVPPASTMSPTGNTAQACLAASGSPGYLGTVQGLLLGLRVRSVRSSRIGEV